MSDLVIGTAGHIDHGKTALIKALTGIDTDRLKEEKMRGITIEPGFAYLALPGGKKAALVDVPGHERFIKNMLAGSAGIDLALLVIAADEGIMPQTREHLDILELLAVKEIVVVITKTDLVEDDYLELVREEITGYLQETPYKTAPVAAVSAKTGEGVDALREMLEKTAEGVIPSRKRQGFSRLPLDRVFTMQGFGTIGTGTLFNGEIKTGESLEIATKNKTVRVRNLQVHGASVAKARAGQRVAVNLAGVEAGELERGDVLTTPGWLQPSSRVDLFCRHLASSPRPLKQQTRIRFHQGTKETLGRVVLLEQDELVPGESAYLQIVLEEPVVVLRGDHCIIRSYSPPRTIGGGVIVEPNALKHKRYDPKVTAELSVLASGDAVKITQLYLEKKKKPAYSLELARYLYLEEKELQPLLQELYKEQKAVSLPIGEEIGCLSKTVLCEGEKAISREIEKHRAEYPLESGVNKEYLRGRLYRDWEIKEFNALLAYWVEKGVFSLINNQYLVLHGQDFRLEETWQERIAAIKEYYLNCGWLIPDWEKVKTTLNLNGRTADQVLNYLLRTGQLIALGSGIYLWHALLEETKATLIAEFAGKEEFSVAEARDLFKTSRKIMVPLLEHLDKTGFTSRKGKGRVLNTRGTTN